MEDLDTENISLKSEDVYQGITGVCKSNWQVRGSRNADTWHCALLCSFANFEPSAVCYRQDLGLCTTRFLVVSTEPGLQVLPDRCISFCTAMSLCSPRPALRSVWAGTLHQALFRSWCSVLRLLPAPWGWASCTVHWCILCAKQWAQGNCFSCTLFIVPAGSLAHTSIKCILYHALLCSWV